jgi:lysophospholipase L1-like esterase
VKRVLLAALLLAIPVVATPAPSGVVEAAPQTTAADTPDAIMLVVDTSGSMNDDDGTGRTKLVGAKRALQNLIGALAGGPRFGLRAYPDPATAGDPDCNEGRQVFPLVKVAKGRETQLNEDVRGLHAVGGTPTAAALKAAARDLRASSVQSAMIVLISDGESNCNVSPCDVAKSIEQSGIDVTVNTVGFQISDAGRTELSCVADATGGRYVDVTSSDQLANEITAITTGALELTLDYQAHVDTIAGSKETPDAINITATVKSTGSQSATNAVLRLQFSSTNSPTVLNPVRRLGNLASPSSTDVSWSFRAPADFNNRTVEFTVEATADNALKVDKDGAIVLRGEVELSDAGPILKGKQRVVILGDSYSAGEGAGTYTKATDLDDNACHRSPLTYGAALFEHLPTNLACSGAVTHDYWYANTGNKREPRQATQLAALAQRPDLVLASFGGNDIGFKSIIIKCLSVGDCQTLRQTTIVPCSTPGATGGGGRGGCKLQGPTFETEVTQRIDKLAPALEDVYRSMDRIVNGADPLNPAWGPGPGTSGKAIVPIVVMPYPLITPRLDGFADVVETQCSDLFSNKEWAFVTRVNTMLNVKVKEAVDALRAEGRPIYLAEPVQQAFQPDHTVCDAEPFANFLDISNTIVFGADFLTRLGSESIPSYADARKVTAAFHPNAAGYKAMTAGLARWSQEFDEPVTRTVKETDPLLLKPVDITPAATWTVSNAALGQLDAQAGNSYLLNLNTFDPGTMVEVSVNSEPTYLGRFPSTSTTAVITLPDTMPRGNHTLVLEGVQDKEVVQFRVPLVIHLDEPWYVRWIVPILGSCLLVVLVGSVLLLRSRRRYRRYVRYQGSA